MFFLQVFFYICLWIVEVFSQSDGAGKAIPSTKVKVKSEITPKQAVKTARKAGPVTTAQRKEIQNQAKKTLKENKTINKTDT